MWISKAAKIERGKSIRGGIPVCWPWFGAHPQNSQMPLHGFVRLEDWKLECAAEIDRNTTSLIFYLTESDIAPHFIHQQFNARLIVTVSKSLKVSLEILNTGNESLTYTAGLHSYFNIGDISSVSVKGVDGLHYLNKVSGAEEIRKGDLIFNGLTSGIFHNITEATICDPLMHRQITVGVTGSRTIVIWNPGPGVENQFPGFACGDERTMLCVEAAVPAGEDIVLLPGEKHELSTIIRAS